MKQFDAEQINALILNEQLIQSTAAGYQYNSELHITTDCQRFDSFIESATKASSVVTRVELLKSAIDLYDGKVLSSAESEHWLIHFSSKYHLLYIGAVNELLKQLHALYSYDLLNQYAMKSLSIAPENTRAYYWLIRSYQKQNMDEMAAGELAAARQKLPEDEYQKLLSSLER